MAQQRFRIEKDSLGEVRVPKAVLWGAQTQRSLEFFDIGADLMPLELICAIAVVKQCAAAVHASLGVLDAKKAKAIGSVAKDIRTGTYDSQFPLKVFQTGSGTQTNMNVNEVIARVAGGGVHAHDDVNRSQSSNDVVPTAMQLAFLVNFEHDLSVSIRLFIQSLGKKSVQFQRITKIGRTHLQDAVSMTVGEEFLGYVGQLELAFKGLRNAADLLREIPIGGTAVGTGLNVPRGYSLKMVSALSKELGFPLKESKNCFALQAGKEVVVQFSASLRTLAVALYTIANNIRLLGSGPLCGLGELILPANEPGSSMMPGKVNPTQCEALCMVCADVMGADATVAFCGSQGQLQLNTHMPVMAYAVLRSMRLLRDGMDSLRKHCIDGIQVNRKVLERNVEQSLMNVTALVPKIGYEKVAEMVKRTLVEKKLGM